MKKLQKFYKVEYFLMDNLPNNLELWLFLSWIYNKWKIFEEIMHYFNQITNSLWNACKDHNLLPVVIKSIISSDIV